MRLEDIGMLAWARAPDVREGGLLPAIVQDAGDQRVLMLGWMSRAALQATLESGWVTNRQIEAARIAMTRKIRRGGKVWINLFPDKPFTKKPAETRMGSGKGSPEGWVAVVKPGRVMFELSGVSEPLAREALRLAAQKLPVKTRFVKREADLFES